MTSTTLEHPWDLDDAVSRMRYWYDHDQPYLAMAYLNRWTTAHPEIAELWFYRAIFCSRLGLRLEEANSWRLFLRLHPHNRLLTSLLQGRLHNLAAPPCD